MSEPIHIGYYKSPIGWTEIKATDGYITSVIVIDEEIVEQPITNNQIPIIEQCINELEEYFAGSRTLFTVPIKQKGTDFQQKVWLQLCTIPYGDTIPYNKLARSLGDEKLTRAVGSANGKNRLWIIVPCHRVIGATGNLTGYAGGIWRKRYLLQHEARFVKHSGTLF